MSTRSYVSVVRAEAAAEKRDRVIQAAARFLREEESIAAFSLDTVAKAAGVTRLTVYNQFGSRRGLLEAVFDDIARRGRLVRLNDAMAASDPWSGLDQLVEIFCDFWSSDPAVARLHDAMGIDPEFAQALLERNARRRQLLEELVVRMTGRLASPSAQRDAIDLTFALTSCAMFRMLASERSAKAVCDLVRDASRAAIGRIISGN
ncbi:TetR/AcrR family transcriptional regulator [Phyllobacterium brassicacearum]|uniref:TetR/AcrR family transcriptional regulator n=1 Tax=Phyllobacterium brassicacearum TaxID=314235 RepID=A0A2P7B8X3_9HYPH|nr:TetR/AcrR family transcriptional regulator [Phyllobacterium brassicacearum]PSH62920.1 TetR/AcrR family transcriptional regulator [Phyllobacterium brassicacearum]TDQ13667.1 TetR family transcriptional regulator [Phyllobacterium brassicacearum]